MHDVKVSASSVDEVSAVLRVEVFIDGVERILLLAAMFPGSQDVPNTLVQEGILTLSLDHVLAVQAEVKHAAVEVDGSFGVQLLQDSVQGDERPCTAHTGAAVYDGGPSARGSIHVVPDCPNELDQGLGALWDAVVGPDGVVEVTHHPRVTAGALRCDLELSDGPLRQDGL